jgi:hypothetical protein
MKKFSYKIDFQYFLSEDALLQCALLLISLLLGMALRTVVQRYDKTHQNVENPLKIRAIVPFIVPLVSTVLIAVFSTVLEQSGIAPKILSPAQQLVFGWIAAYNGKPSGNMVFRAHHFARHPNACCGHLGLPC